VTDLELRLRALEQKSERPELQIGTGAGNYPADREPRLPREESSFLAQCGATQDRLAAERRAAGAAAVQAAIEEQRENERTERERKARNAPRIAALDAEIDAVRSRYDAEFANHCEPLESKLVELRAERRKLL
jgi:hypothetical protein